MARWVRVADAGDIPVGESRGVSVEGKEVGLFNVNGELFAIDNACPHRGAPLSDGRLEGAQIVCPWHGWAFDVKSGGLAMDPNRCQKIFAVEKKDGGVYVDVGEGNV
jgi:nitrite reductase (NADH) small subunit